MTRDPGLQAERTAQAWERTAFVMAVDALLVLRAGAHADSQALLAGGGLLGVAVLAIAATTSCRRRALRAAPRAIAPAIPAVMMFVVLGCVVAGAATLAWPR